MKKETDLWKYLRFVMSGQQVYLQRLECKQPVGVPDVLYTVSDTAKEKHGACATLKNKNLGECYVRNCTGWVELKLVLECSVGYAKPMAYGIRAEQALWLFNWCKHGGEAWILIGFVTKENNWSRFMLVHGKHAYDVFRKVTISQLERLSTVFEKHIDPVKLALLLANGRPERSV